MSRKCIFVLILTKPVELIFKVLGQFWANTALQGTLLTTQKYGTVNISLFLSPTLRIAWWLGTFVLVIVSVYKTSAPSVLASKWRPFQETVGVNDYKWCGTSDLCIALYFDINQIGIVNNNSDWRVWVLLNCGMRCAGCGVTNLLGAGCGRLEKCGVRCD